MSAQLKDPRARKIDSGIALRLIGERGNVHPRDVLAVLHQTEAAAQWYIDLNASEYGHPSWGPMLTESGWLEVVDLRPAFKSHGLVPTDPSLPDDYSGPR